MSFVVQLLGHPAIDDDGERFPVFRSRKSWALLAYLLSTERPPSRRQLAALLFGEADDPLRALRWCIGEIRSALGQGGSIVGDPVVLRMPLHATVDVSVVTRGEWAEAVRLPGLGLEFLEGVAFREAAPFEAWLLAERRRLAAASEAILHEAALGMMSRGDLEPAIGCAVRLIGMNALDENHQALLIRLYRLMGDDVAAQSQFAACAELFRAELGLDPGPAVQEALRARRTTFGGGGAGDGTQRPVENTTVAAAVEAGRAAVGAGAIETGVQILRRGVFLSDAGASDSLRATSRLALAEALVHSLRGQDEEGLAALHAADEVARQLDDPGLAAEARAEIGYVDFLRARYDRAEIWLSDARRLGRTSLSMVAKSEMYLGSVASDRGNYPAAWKHLVRAGNAARPAGEVRMESFALAMLGRFHILRHDFGAAAVCLDRSLELCEQSHWLAFVPWPQALRGEVELGRTEPELAAAYFDQAFARACQLGDPCWEGMSARGRALAAEAIGESDRAFEILADARIRSDRLADPYVWLDAHILDAQCSLGLRHGHPDTGTWAAALGSLASRTGMKEFVVRSLLHAEALGDDGAGQAARLLGAEIDNPALAELLGIGG